ncbi:MAG TPA: hypothetical protein VFO01_07905 [Trebonia sp.]|nr:hypothetical protein [Trebonia sp.]
MTSKKTGELDTKAAVKAANRTRAASSAAAAHAVSAAHSAAVAAQNAADLAQVAAQNAAVVATNAAHNASEVAQMAANSVNKGVKEVRQGVYTARGWAAPRLDNAADYWTATAAPKVSSALRTTARQVAPAPAKSPKRSSVLTWSVLGAAIAAAVGAAAVIARYRYRAAIAADSETADEEEVLGDSTGSQPAPPAPDEPRSATPAKDPGTDTPANGRVASSGW